MFAQLFRDALTEYAYDAELAGLDYSLNNSKFGLTVGLRELVLEGGLVWARFWTSLGSFLD